ncbi:aspartyl-tRNA synthetase [Nematocida homosporus]|uniref:aspartyl-tRNA synthetase n=1 Tax=Nematocida homosporus TaxID=1912981 RepID=UPI00221F21F2|nr:aspartyl-tRNA synthetase [Nematocida homosporus]KAI5185207.1 aspartyl-tRNA synthetase [Nematocida homosporus]
MTALEEHRLITLTIAQLASQAELGLVSIYGFISSIRLVGKNKVFMVLREGGETVQAVYSGSGVEGLGLELRSKLTAESYVGIRGKLVETKQEILSCTVKRREIQVEDVEIVSLAAELPYQLKDLSWTAQERVETPQLPVVGLSKRLDLRSLDLRSVESRSIFLIYSGVLQAFRSALVERNYLEIKTPKLLGGASEGGADVFVVDYFKEKASLAQSPQLYKQLAVIGGLERVFEIGPCFRAENSNTGRHLTEFTGVDLERELKGESYINVVGEIYDVLKTVIRSVGSKYEAELKAITEITGRSNTTIVTDAPVILTFKEGIDILREIGRSGDYLTDIGTEDERLLGEQVKLRYQTDLFVLVNYPASARPFYTALLPEDSNYTQSYDFIFKGEEILSGAVRIHEHEVLLQRVRAKGIAEESVRPYTDSFIYGVPPHAGCGIGLERVVKLLTETGDIHKCSMFPRDPSRLHP